MGAKVGKRKDSRAISGFSIKELNELVTRGGKAGSAAKKELTKRGVK